ncbi:MAG: Rv3654c family TadE-like protein [Pontimonas sp.]
MDQEGSATIALAGMAGAIVVLGVVATSVGAHVIFERQVAHAVDAAALAAADVSVGVTPGEPCSVAREVLKKSELALVSCEYWRESWVISGRAEAGLLDANATARAGVVDGGGK